MNSAAHYWAQLVLSPSPYGGIEKRISSVSMPRALVAVRPEEPYMTANPSASPGFPQELTAARGLIPQVQVPPLMGKNRSTNTPERIPECDPTWRNRDGTEDDRADVRPPSVLLARTTATTGVSGVLPTLPEARGVAGIIGRVAVSTTRARALCAADNSHIISLLTVTLRSVVLLKQQPELGLLTRSASRATAHVQGPLAVSGNLSGKPGARGGCRQCDPGRGTVPPDQKLVAPHPALPLPQQGSPTVVWDELMKIRLSGWQEDAAASSHQDPLRGAEGWRHWRWR
ncbi:hypothetical protein BJY52DRAFT_1217427 [Lactarius psammicola]|nr:hypothetical protein BJY52DRAFT_1217427 [Lactarius psammicola]